MEVVGNAPEKTFAQKVKEAAQAEVNAEKMKSAKEKIVGLLKKEAQAKQVLKNIEQELADAYKIIEGDSV